MEEQQKEQELKKKQQEYIADLLKFYQNCIYTLMETEQLILIIGQKLRDHGVDTYIDKENIVHVKEPPAAP